MIIITLKYFQTIKDEIDTIDFFFIFLFFIFIFIFIFKTKMNLIVKVKDKECFSSVKEYVKKIL